MGEGLFSRPVIQRTTRVNSGIKYREYRIH